MDFFIKQNATLPTLRVEVVKDGRSDFAQTQEFLNQTEILFSMVDIVTGQPKIVGAPCTTELLDETDENISKYLIKYQFNFRDTKNQGRFKGTFRIQNNQGDIVLPLTEDLFINITESISETDFCC